LNVKVDVGIVFAYSRDVDVFDFEEETGGCSWDEGADLLSSVDPKRLSENRELTGRS